MRLSVLLIAITFAVPSGCAASARDYLAEGEYYASFKGDKQSVTRARACFRRAIQADPNFARAYLQLGIMDAREKDYRKALRNIEKAVRLMEASNRRGDDYLSACQLAAQVAANVDAKTSLTWWRKYLSLIRGRPRWDMEVSAVEDVIARLVAGGAPGKPSPADEPRPAKWQPVEVPRFKVADLFAIVRGCAASGGKLPSPKEHLYLAEPYGGALFATFFTSPRRRTTLRGTGRTFLQALRRMLEKPPRAVLAHPEAPLVISWVTDVKDMESVSRIQRDFQPGIEGLAVGKMEYRFALVGESCIWGGLASEPADTATAMVVRITEQMGAGAPAEIPFFRFRTETYLQSAPGETPVKLFRAHGPEVKPTGDAVRKSLIAAGEYLARNQKKDGTFPYRYLARKGYADREAESLIRQAGAAWSLLVLGRGLGRDDFIEAGRRAAKFFQTQLARDEKRGFAFLVDGDRGATLGVAALTALMFLEARKRGAAEYENHARDLSNFLLFMQEEDGTFRSYHVYREEPEIPRPPSRIYPQEAVCALAKIGRVLGEKKYLDAATRGTRILLKDKARLLKSRSTAALDHWLLIAVAELMEAGVKGLDTDTVMRTAERILALRRKEGPWDLRGAADNAPFPRGPVAASLNEALVAAHRVARKKGLRTDKLEAGIRGLAAFQLRHQVTPIDTYHLADPKAALGGFRLSLLKEEVRVDFVQHNILSLLGALEIIRE